jgi:hypothetical protein
VILAPINAESCNFERQKNEESVGICYFLNNLSYKIKYRSRDIVVGIATGYRLDDRGVGVRVPVG